jgi:hypothetical protein
MRAASLGVVVLALVAVQARATSLMQYWVELGGDSHGGTGEQFFTPGSQVDGQVYRVGDVITWDVVLGVSGIHAQPGHPANGHAVYGAANIVYDLELKRSGTGGSFFPVPEATFFSSAQPGRPAAFAMSYDVGGNGPGRLQDPASMGGPYLDVHLYPRDRGDGRLAGMGAGYSAWDTSGFGKRTAGVGMDTLPNGSPGLGVVPITEGQINTSLMQPGFYVLSVNPAGGNNVLRGDLDLTVDQYAFAVAANEVRGDTISFTLLPEPGAMVILAVGSLVMVRIRRAR